MTRGFSWMFCVFFFALFPLSAVRGEDLRAHGLWVWKNPPVVDAPQGAEKLRDFCRFQSINEVYVSVSANGGPSQDASLASLIDLLHRSGIRVEAFLSSDNADELAK